MTVTAEAAGIIVQYQGGAFLFDSLDEANRAVQRWVGEVTGITWRSPTSFRVTGPNGSAAIQAG